MQLSPKYDLVSLQSKPESSPRAYCGGVECPAPEKSPDLGNSSPDPRAFMYIESATDLSGKQARNIHLKDRRFVRRSRTRTGLRLGGCGQDLRTGVTDTD